MNGIQIVKPNARLLGGTPSDRQLDTELETLPIALFANWAITVYTGYQIGVPPTLEYAIQHGLDFVPLFRGWEEEVVGGETVYRSIPTDIDSNGFITTLTADETYVYVKSDFTASQYLGSTYRKKGYVYVYEKKFEGLPL